LKKLLLEKIKESVQAILPLTIVITIVLLFFKVDATTIFTFLAGVIMLMVGLVIFSIGSESSIMGLAKEIGAFIVKKKNLVFFLIVALLLGFLITIAEPSVLVLGKQFESTVPLYTMVLTIALGSALFALISLLRVLFKIPIKYLIIVLYAILFTIGCFTHFDFIPVSFDAGGFSTGPMAVPFLLALGFGIVSTQEDSTSEDSFGILGITSMGPIFAVMLLGAFYKNPTFTVDAEGTVKVMAIIIDNLKNVAFAIVPFVIFFIVFQITAFKYPAARVKAILLGFLLTYVGLVLFLSGASLGFMKTGPYLFEQFSISLNKLNFVPDYSQYVKAGEFISYQGYEIGDEFDLNTTEKITIVYDIRPILKDLEYYNKYQIEKEFESLSANISFEYILDNDKEYDTFAGYKNYEIGDEIVEGMNVIVSLYKNDDANAYEEVNVEEQLMISKYIGGFSWNMGIELWNPTDEDIDLADYYIAIIPGGQITVDKVIQLDGILHSNAVYTIVNTNADTELRNKSNMQTTQMDFGANSTIQLRRTRNRTYIDTIYNIANTSTSLAISI
jgi:hypothetical protein